MFGEIGMRDYFFSSMAASNLASSPRLPGWYNALEDEGSDEWVGKPSQG